MQAVIAGAPAAPAGSPSCMTSTPPSRTPPPGSRARSKRPRFAPHWERERLQAALKSGGAHRAALRFSAADRAQAFATLPGLRTDVMVRVRLPVFH